MFQQSLDERMVKYSGRWGYIKYNPMKPVKRGILMYLICDSDGYCRGARIYCGDAKYELGVGATDQIVIALLRTAGLLDAGHKIFMDSYYTSYPLLQMLRRRFTYGLGTYKVSSLSPALYFCSKFLDYNYMY